MTDAELTLIGKICQMKGIKAHDIDEIIPHVKGCGFDDIIKAIHSEKDLEVDDILIVIEKYLEERHEDLDCETAWNLFRQEVDLLPFRIDPQYKGRDKSEKSRFTSPYQELDQSNIWLVDCIWDGDIFYRLKYTMGPALLKKRGVSKVVYDEETGRKKFEPTWRNVTVNLQSVRMAYQLDKIRKMRPQDPCRYDIMNCLLRDADGVEQPFEDWCLEFGYNDDSISALNIFRECGNIYHALRRVMPIKTLQKLYALTPFL